MEFRYHSKTCRADNLKSYEKQSGEQKRNLCVCFASKLISFTRDGNGAVNRNEQRLKCRHLRTHNNQQKRKRQKQRKKLVKQSAKILFLSTLFIIRRTQKSTERKILKAQRSFFKLLKFSINLIEITVTAG